MLRFVWFLGLVLTAAAAPLMGQLCPKLPPVTWNSPSVPSDVCLPSDIGSAPEDQLPYFDDYSWRAFLAMVWPARAGERGVPDYAKKPTGAGPVVFQTFKALWEVLRPDSSGKCCAAPVADWNYYEDASANGCNAGAGFGDMIMASFSRYSDINEALFGSLEGPLVAQNRTYVRYAVGFNHIEFDEIRKQQLYDQAKLNNVVFPAGTLDVKSAWMEMSGVGHPGRYYTIDALVRDPDGRCSVKRMGLIGLHIVQKTPSRPQYIWSTFEQIDNVPPAALGPLGAEKPYALNNGKAGLAKPPLTSNPHSTEDNRDIAWPVPQNPPPPNVVRSTDFPIHPKTQKTNAAYRAALQQLNSVWQYYQLVLTQFPVPCKLGINCLTVGFDMFPNTNATSAVANLTMETFNQEDANGAPGYSCLGCHVSVRDTSDFVWVLTDRTQRLGSGFNLIGKSPKDLEDKVKSLSAPNGKQQ